MVSVRDYLDSDYDSVRQNLVDGDLFDPELDTREALQAKARQLPGSILVADAPGAPAIGSVYLLYDRWNAFVFRLAVRSTHRDQGVGTALLAAAEERLRSWGAKELSLFYVTADAKLSAFYEKRGYRPWQEAHTAAYKRL